MKYCSKRMTADGWRWRYKWCINIKRRRARDDRLTRRLILKIYIRVDDELLIAHAKIRHNGLVCTCRRSTWGRRPSKRRNRKSNEATQQIEFEAWKSAAHGKPTSDWNVTRHWLLILECLFFHFRFTADSSSVTATTKYVLHPHFAHMKC